MLLIEMLPSYDSILFEILLGFFNRIYRDSSGILEDSLGFLRYCKGFIGIFGDFMVIFELFLRIFRDS